MSDQVTSDTVEEALDEVTHPEIDASLVELGMIDDVTVDGETAAVDVAIPMPTIPEAIKSMLAQRVSEGVASLGVDAKVEFVVMDAQTRDRFFELETQEWSGLSGESSDTPSAPF